MPKPYFPGFFDRHGATAAVPCKARFRRRRGGKCELAHNLRTPGPALACNYIIGSTAIALGDLNHEDCLDAEVDDPRAFTRALLRNGAGAFSTVQLASGPQPGAIATADLNGDAIPDLGIGTTSDFGGGLS